MRNRIKAVIGKAKRAFLNTALSSKRRKEVWWVIHRVLHPSPRPIYADPDKLNSYFIKTTERTLGKLPDKGTDLVDLIDSLPEPDRYPFQLRTVSTGQVLKEISLLRSDCSTGVDQISVKYVKQVCRFPYGSPCTYHQSVCISNSQFPRIWKTARISPVPNKVDNPKQNADYQPVSILPALSKVFERLVLKQNRPLYGWTIFITPKHLGLQERTVHHSGHEEGWGHHDGHGRLFEGIWYQDACHGILLKLLEMDAQLSLSG